MSISRRQYRWLFCQLRHIAWQYCTSVVLVVISGLLFLLDPLLIKWLIDAVLPAKSIRLLSIAAAGLLAIYLTRLALSTVATHINNRAVQISSFHIRHLVLEQMCRLSAEYHESTPVGEKLYRVQQDIDQVAEVGANVIPYGVQTFFNTIFVAGAMLALNPRLTGAAIPLVPLFFVVKKRFELHLQKAAENAEYESTREGSFLQELLSAVVQVQLLRCEKEEIERFSSYARRKMNARDQRTRTELAFSASCMMAVALGTVLMVAYGGYEVFIGALTVGGLIAFYSYLSRLFDPVHAAVDIYSQLTRLTASLSRITEIFDSLPAVASPLKAVFLKPPLRGQLKMEDIAFAYTNGKTVLDCVNLAVEPGQKVALVGASGSGKSTVAKLAARLYNPIRGTVWVDGIHASTIDVTNFRTHICYVMQEPCLFDLTIKENLQLGNPSAGTAQLIRALEIAELLEFIERLPNGWDTRIGPRGGLLSGGERQRLALARAAIQNAGIMLFDECTSALDAPTERVIFSNLANHFADRTIVFISHRLTSLNWVDNIFVLGHGVLQEQGSHRELIDTGGIYRQLYQVAPLGDC